MNTERQEKRTFIRRQPSIDGPMQAALKRANILVVKDVSDRDRRPGETDIQYDQRMHARRQEDKEKQQAELYAAGLAPVSTVGQEVDTNLPDQRKVDMLNERMRIYQFMEVHTPCHKKKLVEELIAEGYSYPRLLKAFNQLTDQGTIGFHNAGGETSRNPLIELIKTGPKVEDYSRFTPRKYRVRNDQGELVAAHVDVPVPQSAREELEKLFTPKSPEPEEQPQPQPEVQEPQAPVAPVQFEVLPDVEVPAKPEAEPPSPAITVDQILDTLTFRQGLELMRRLDELRGK